MKTLSLILALLLCFVCTGFAEAVNIADPETPFNADLDGDGVEETISIVAPNWDDETTEDYDTVITVTKADGKEAVYRAPFQYDFTAYVTDADNDGVNELLLSGDLASSDYYTVCLNLVGDEIYDSIFADVDRGDYVSNMYSTGGYGFITTMNEDGSFTLSGSQDMLGTWFASRTFKWSPAGRFETCDDGYWVRTEDARDSDYGWLTVKKEIPVTWDGGEEGTLAVGEKIYVYATDKQEHTLFSMEDGRSGSLYVEPDYAQGYGFCIDGVSENDCFESLFYAD